MARRIHIKGIRRTEIDTDLLAYVYFLQGKRLVQQRRKRAVEGKPKRPASSPDKRLRRESEGRA
jgi:hypothetical protein